MLSWVIGYGGLGKSISLQLQDQGYEVAIFNRHPIENITNKFYQVDFSDESQVENFFSNKIDLPQLIVVCCGFLSDQETQPEKSITKFYIENFIKNLQGNLYPTLNLCKYLTRQLKRDSLLNVFSFSARVSSVDDNHIGGWHSYRMSKSALNMLIKNISIEWRLKSPHAKIFGYHPGTVKTSLSNCFLSRIDPKSIFSPTQAAEFFLEFVQQKKDKQSGFLYDWAGELIPF